MLNNLNVHEKLIKQVPTVTNDEFNRIKILMSYDDAILLPNNEIIDLSEFEINLNSTSYSLDLPSNKSNEIFYFDEKINKKKYLEVPEFEYQIVNEYRQKLKYFKMTFDYNISENLSCLFYVLEYENDEIINIIEVNDDELVLEPLENTEFFRVCLKLTGSGIIYNLNFSIREKYREVLNQVDVHFENDKFYNTAKEIEISNSEDGILINVGSNEKQHMYISYNEMNNKFTNLPDNNLFQSLNFDNQIMSHINMSKDDTLEVIPMLIEYSETEKINIKKLSTLNQEVLSFKDESVSLRFVLRISGSGGLYLKSLKMQELESITLPNKMNFESRKDVISIITPQLKLKEYKVACIMDEFTFNSFDPEVQLYKISPNKWKSELLFIQPDLLFIESAWVGNDGSWNKKVAYYDDEQHSEIKSLIKFGQSLEIPVVFWNKEDPVHYDRFIETAKLCDFVFTTDRGRIPQYIKDCGHDNVAALPFAAQPKNHNPIKIQKERDPRVSFAGSYYRHHEERSKDMDILLEASKEIGLVIYDRNYEKTSKGQMPNHMYPERFLPYVNGSLPFNLIDKSYKGYKYMINVNTVKHSETMFSRRVFEGLISGTPIISTYSLGMKKMFGDIIESSSSIEHLRFHLNKLDNDTEIYNKYALRGIREVLLKHTYEQRMKSILHSVGYTVKSNKTNIYFIALVDNDDEINDYISIFDKQTVLNKKLIIIHKNIVNYKKFYNKYNTDEIIGIDYNVLKKYINIRQLLGQGYLIVLNKEHYYGENYALDLILAKTYSEADIIGKSMYYTNKYNELKIENKGNDFIYTPDIKVDRSVIRISVFDKFSVASTLEYLEGNISLDNLMPYGAKLFSGDSLNFIEDGMQIGTMDKVKI